MALEPLSALWPCLVMVPFLSLYRKLIDFFLDGTSEHYARQQIDHAMPEWMPDTLTEMNSNYNVTATPDLRHHPTPTTPREKFDDFCRQKGVFEVFELFSSSDVPLVQQQRRELKTYHKAVNDLATKKNKFLESVFKATVVTAVSVYGFYVVNIRLDLFVHHRNQWPKYPDTEPYRQQTDSFLLWYYILSIGYHVHRSLTQFHNPKRDDFVALFIHHWSTNILLLFSYLAAFLRTGSLVLWMHENSDILLELAKICSYCHWAFGKELFFGLFVISWFVMRLWAFSYKVLYEIVRFGSKQLWIGDSPLFFNWTCVILLFILEALHIYWSLLLCVVLVRKLRGGATTDIRSETEDDEDGVAGVGRKGVAGVVAQSVKKEK